MRPLKPEEMAERPMAELIAQRLKEFHGIEVGATTESQLFTTIEKWYSSYTLTYKHASVEIVISCGMLSSSVEHCFGWLAD